MLQPNEDVYKEDNPNAKLDLFWNAYAQFCSLTIAMSDILVRIKLPLRIF